MRGVGPSTASGPRLIRSVRRAYPPLADVPASSLEATNIPAVTVVATPPPRRITTPIVNKCSAFVCSKWHRLNKPDNIDVSSIERLIRGALALAFMDILWARTMSTRYENLIISVQSGAPAYIRWQPFVCVYILMIIALWGCVLTVPGWKKDHTKMCTIKLTVSRSAFVGFIIWATYNATNMSAFAQWGVWISIVDTIWGMIMYSIAGLATVL